MHVEEACSTVFSQTYVSLFLCKETNYNVGGMCLVAVGLSRNGLALPGGACLVVVGVSRDGLVQLFYQVECVWLL